MTEDNDLYPHPIGTLVIVGFYGALFVLGWLGMYLFIYLARGHAS